MGDFGPLVGEELPFSIHLDDKVLHKVILSDFSISKFKVTNYDFSVYLRATGKDSPPINILVKDYPSLAKDDYPVGVIWQQAKDYCQWLGRLSNKKNRLTYRSTVGICGKNQRKIYSILNK